MKFCLAIRDNEIVAYHAEPVFCDDWQRLYLICTPDGDVGWTQNAALASDLTQEQAEAFLTRFRLVIMEDVV